MIGKGNLHGDGGALARYLMTGEKGEITQLLETRGLEDFSRDPVEAFERLQQLADNRTKSPLPFFHTQTRNAPGEHLTDAQWSQVADREEKRLGFTGQPRIVSFHIDPTSGEKHLHVGWFRIDLETMQAIDPGLYKNHLKQLCRKLEKEFCLQEVSNTRKPDDRARAASWKEQEEARRLGIDDRAIRNTILDCLEHADGGKAFRAALDERGLMLANGDKRDCFVVIDQAGGHHPLNKRLTGHTLAETRERFADLDRAQLPSVEEAKEIQRTRTAEREANAGRTAEPVAPNFDRDAANREWEEKIAAAGIAAAADRAMREARAAAKGRTDDVRAEMREAPQETTRRAEPEIVAPAPAPELAPEVAPLSEHEMRSIGSILGGVFGGIAGKFENFIAAIADVLSPPPPMTKDQAERAARSADEQAEANATAAAAQEKDERLQATLDQMARARQEEDFAARYGTPRSSGRERDDDYGGRERERDR